MSAPRRPRARSITFAVVALVGALGVTAIAVGGPPPPTIVTGGGELKPSTLPKNKHAPAALTVRIDTETTNPNGVPDPVTNVLLNFDDDGKVTTTGLPVCRASLAGTTTEQARQACRSSMIGKGMAEAIAPGDIPTDAVVTLFNGPKRGGNPTILLHNRATELPITVVLQGVLRKSRAGRDFGPALDVPVELPPGAVFINIRTTVKKTWRYRGKKYSYVSARCHDANKRLNVHAEIDLTIDNVPQTQTGDVVQKCKVKRTRR
jgi:hypothetical protein